MVKLRRIDLEKERAGSWCAHPDGFSVKVRSVECPLVQEELSKAIATELGKTPGKEALTPAELEAVIRDVYSRTVLLEWKDLDEFPDVTPANALTLMSDPELRNFQSWVIAQARDSQRNERRGVEAIAKN